MNSHSASNTSVSALLSLGMLTAFSLCAQSQTVQGQQALGSVNSSAVLSSAVEMANSICQTIPLQQTKTVVGGNA
jgi:hypothetical protein